MRKVSIIIAAYNVEKYIHECLKSAYNQTLEDIEIIVCDDCSTDNTLDVVKAVAEKDSRVKVIANANNSGTMLNRKSGIDAATGEYIMFLDGDDFLSFDACEKAYNAIKKENVDILQFGTNVFAEYAGYEDMVYGVNEYLKFPEEKVIVPVNGGLMNKKYVHHMNYTLWNKIYNADIVHSMSKNLPTERINLREDLLQVYLLLFFAKSYYYISDKLYHYRIGVGISTIKAFTDSKLEARAKAYYVYKWLKDWTDNAGASEICKERLNEIKIQMLDNVAATILEKIPKNKRQWYIDIALTYCPKEEFIAYLSYLVYGIKYYREEELAKLIKSVNLFKATPKKIKTIGTFYHRIYNGGVEKVISQLSDIWNKENYRVILFTDESPNKDDYPLNKNTIRVVIPTTPLHTYDEYLARTKFWIDTIEKYDIDVMIYHAWLNINKLADISSVKSCGIPFIVHTHGIFCSALDSADYIYAYRTSNLSYIYQCIDSIITLTDVDSAWWNSKGLRTFKTLNPIQLSADIMPAELNGKNILISARVSRDKKIEDSIEILALVKNHIPDVTLTIIGGCDDSDYNQFISNLIARYNLESNVRLVGYVSDVKPYYQNADVLLSTSPAEGFGLSLMESKICGIPLVCYYLPNLDIARNPKGMINIPQGDIYAAADEIVKILTDDEYKKTLGRQARESGIEYLKADISRIWNNIFDDIYKNDFHINNGTPIKDPLATATDIMVEFNAKGIERRNSGGNFDSQELIHYKLQCNALDNTIKEIRNSTAYKVGLAITSIPRKIKSLLKK